MTEHLETRLHACLLGGAIGDALGAPVEFMSWSSIQARYGPGGVSGFESAYGGRGRVTDDTQMTFFTVEGLVDAASLELDEVGDIAARVQRAYLRWLASQGWAHPLLTPQDRVGGLLEDARLHAQRAPGNTCLAALRAADTLEAYAANDSKGCGTVMRAAPFGFWPGDNLTVFELAALCSDKTHGHPTAAMASGAVAVMIRRLSAGEGPHAAFRAAMRALALRGAEAAETRAALEAAAAWADRRPGALDLETLGGAWVADEALAIAVAAWLGHGGDVTAGLLASVNHSGDADSTGAICGNLYGAWLGLQALPEPWREEVEMADVAARLAREFAGARKV